MLQPGCRTVLPAAGLQLWPWLGDSGSSPMPRNLPKLMHFVAFPSLHHLHAKTTGRLPPSFLSAVPRSVVCLGATASLGPYLQLAKVAPGGPRCCSSVCKPGCCKVGVPGLGPGGVPWSVLQDVVSSGEGLWKSVFPSTSLPLPDPGHGPSAGTEEFSVWVTTLNPGDWRGQGVQLTPPVSLVGGRAGGLLQYCLGFCPTGHRNWRMHFILEGDGEDTALPSCCS